MKLANNNPLCTVDDEGSAGSHVGNGSEVDVLHDGLKILVLGIGTVQLQACLKGNRKS